MRPRSLRLTPDQRQELVYARGHAPQPYRREQAAALLKVADGQAMRQVARQGLGRPRTPKTVRRWVTKYEAGGWTALIHGPRGHRGGSPSAGRAPA